MLKIKKFVFNPFSENTLVLSDEQSNCVVIDPGCYHSHEVKELEEYIVSNNLKVVSILQTHSHLDHMFGTSYLANKYKVPVFIHKYDELTFNSFEMVCKMYGIPINYNQSVEINYFDTQKGFYLGRHYLEIKFVPGHAPGHVVFYNAENKFVINGDCLFQSSIGRTDLPGGNHEQLITSIKNELFTLPKDTKVYCGHGPETYIGEEIKHNPFF